MYKLMLATNIFNALFFLSEEEGEALTGETWQERRCPCLWNPLRGHCQFWLDRKAELLDNGMPGKGRFLIT